MANNPFRQNPNKNNVENWGETKFKPKKFGSGGDNKFKKNDRNYGNKNKSFNNNKFGGRNNKGKGSNFHNKEKYKFNVVAKDAKPENSTPWNKYKDEIVYKQREEEQEAQQANMNSSEAKEMLKQREINYRKLLIEQKKQEPTQWEDFNENEDEEKNKKSPKNKNKKFNNSKDNRNKHKNNFEHKLNKNSKTEFKPKPRVFLDQEMLDNFDSKKLNFKQNNYLRAAITKNTLLAKGVSLEKTVKNLKMKKEKAKNKQV